MIDSIHIYIGTLHHHFPETMWEAMAEEMHNKYNCDVVFRTVDDNSDTRMLLDGDLTPAEMSGCQDIFTRHIQK